MSVITDDRALTTFGLSSMKVFGTVIMLYLLQQLIPHQQVESGRYGIWMLGPAGYIMNVENDADEEPLYFGEALPGTLNSEAGWRIYRYEYVRDPVTDDLLSGAVRYAGGNTNFDKVWDNRAEYGYS